MRPIVPVERPKQEDTLALGVPGSVGRAPVGVRERPVLSIGKLLYRDGPSTTSAPSPTASRTTTPAPAKRRASGRHQRRTPRPVGEVDADALHRVLEHADPMTGERLTRGHAVPKVIGFDTTFCAPKSVSLLFGLGDPEVSNEVRNAHDAAVARALAVYETMAQGRRGAGGHTDRRGRRVRRRRLPASDVAQPRPAPAHPRRGRQPRPRRGGRPVVGARRPAGLPVVPHHRAPLQRRAAPRAHPPPRRRVDPVKNGLADIEGVPRSVIDAFSTRSAEIEADLESPRHVRRQGGPGGRLHDPARQDHDRRRADLVARWRTQADGPRLRRRRAGRATLGRRHRLDRAGRSARVEADDCSSPGWRARTD